MKTKKLLAICLSFVMACSLFAGCNNAPKYEREAFKLGENYTVQITKEEVIFDSDDKCDNLMVYFTAKNTGKDEWAFNSTANIIAKQDDEILSLAQVEDESGNKILNVEKGKTKLKPGESIDLIYGWKLENYSPVKVNFGGYTTDVEDTLIEFNVAEKQTAEAKTASDEAASKLANQKNLTELDLSGCSMKLVDGWYVSASDNKTATLKNDSISSGSITITCSSNTSTAAEWGEKLNGNFGGDLTVTSYEANGTNYVRLDPTDTQFILLADQTAAEKSIVKITGMFVTLDQAATQVSNITIK